MEKDVDDTEVLTNSIEYKFRRMQTIPCSLHRTLVSKSIIPLFDYAVVQMRGLRFWGSRFFAFHISRLIEENLPIPSFTSSSILPFVKCIAEGTRPVKDTDLAESIVLWKKTLAFEKDDSTIPSIRGLNTISTKTVEEYFVSFENYHVYGLQSHWSRLIARTYDLSKKRASAVVHYIIGKTSLTPLDTLNTLDVFTDSEQESLRKIGDEEVSLIGDIKNLNTLEGRIKWHACIAKRLANPENTDTMKPVLISLAPFCSASLPFITVCKQSMGDLLAFSKSRNSDHLLTATEKHRIYLDFLYNICPQNDNEKYSTIDTYFKLPNRTGGWVLSPTFKTDGHTLHLIWQKEIIRSKSVTLKEWTAYKEKEEKKQQTWQNEVDLALRENRQPDKRKQYGLKKELPVHVPSQKIWCSNDESKFKEESIGTYSQSVLSTDTLREGTPLYAIDPGMHDILNSTRFEWKQPDSCVQEDFQFLQPVKHKSLSGKSFYSSIGVKSIRNDSLTRHLSECSLHTYNPHTFLSHLGVFKNFTHLIYDTWGSKKLRRAHFQRHRLKRRFYDTITDSFFPEKNAVVCIGDGHIQTTLKGTTTCPLGKIAQSIGKKRRLVYVNERYTTQKCSACCHRNAKTETVPALHKGPQTKANGKVYMPKIHGLRQCPHCARTWNRDYNAARNIHFNVCSFTLHGCPASYLCKSEDEETEQEIEKGDENMAHLGELTRAHSCVTRSSQKTSGKVRTALT